MGVVHTRVRTVVAGAALTVGLALAPAAAAVAQGPADLVRPLAGTAAGGGAFPGADTPFGMVQYSPNTDAAEGGGYDYDHPTTWGFATTHLSGPGCAAMGDVVSLPTTGDVTTVDATQEKTTFSHANEQASPGAYAVDLDASKVHAELTATTHTGWARFTFPRTTQGNVLVDPGANFRGVEASDVHVVGDDTIEGSVSTYGYFNTCPSKSHNRYTVHFSMRFNRPFDGFGTGNGSTVRPGERNATGTDAGAYVSFDASDGRPVVSKVGISFVDLAGAQRNLARETGDRFDFDAVRDRARRDWNDLLGRVRIDGGSTDQRETFYTALYHALLHPNVFSDVDGRYRGFDDEVHSVGHGRAHYTSFSMWDTYRTDHELIDLVAPERVGDMVHSLLDDQRQGGWVPKWAYARYYTNEMVGDPAANVIADAVRKGLVRRDDVAPAYAALLHNATDIPDPAVTPFEGRTGLEQYLDDGFVPYHGGGDYPTSGSINMEYGVNDCALALMARSLGHEADWRYLLRRAKRYRNTIDPQTGFVRPRLADGSWLTPFDPASETGFKEGSAWQYTWLAPQDVSGLAAALGGRDAMLAKLDEFFAYDRIAGDPSAARDAWRGDARYNPYNETDLQAPYLYDYLGQPWKTQDVVRAGETLFSTAPDGIPGNDDLGTMSAWYVLSSLGLYPVTAGDDRYALTSPLFEHASIRAGRGPGLVIDAPGAADAPYVRGVELGHRPLRTSEVSHAALLRAGRLTFRLSATPDRRWATGRQTPGSACAAAPRTADVTAHVSSLPGEGTTTVRATLRNQGDAPATQIDLALHLPGGWTAKASSPAPERLAPGETATREWTVTPPAGARSAAVRADVRWTGPGGHGAALRTFATGTVQVPADSLAAVYDNIGISHDGDTCAASFGGTPNATRGWSYSAEQLAAAGLTPGATVEYAGAQLTWPDVAPGEPDNAIAAGQVVRVHPPAGATRLVVLGSASSGPASGTLTLLRADGTTQIATLAFNDWTRHHDANPVLPGTGIVATTPYRNQCGNPPQQTHAYVFGAAVAIDPGAPVVAVQLPKPASGTLNLFALGFTA